MTIKLEEFLVRSGLDRPTIELWFEKGWIVSPETPEHAELSDIDAARAGFILELERDFGLNDEGVDLVLHLVDQLHGLRQALFSLRIDMRR